MSQNPGGIRYIGAGTAAGASVTKPTGTVQGDLMLIFSISSIGDQTAPSGWTILWEDFMWGGTSYYGIVCYKVHGDEAGTTSYTVTNAEYMWISVYRGADIDVPIGAWSHAVESGTTTPSAAGITTRTLRSMLHGYVLALNAPTYTPPSGMTETPGSDTQGGESCYGIQTEPGASGDKEWTASASDQFDMFLIEIRESQIRRRFYFDSTNAPDITPSSWCAQWDSSPFTNAITRRLNDVRGSSTLTNQIYGKTVSTTNYDYAMARHLVKLGSGPVSGAFVGYIRVAESSTVYNAFAQASIKVVDGSGADVGVAFAGQTNTATSGSEYSTTAANRMIVKPTLTRLMTTVEAKEGDYLVVETGHRANSTTTTRTATHRYGETTTDIVDNETGTSDYSPWIEFPSGVILSGEGPEYMAQMTPMAVPGC